MAAVRKAEVKVQQERAALDKDQAAVKKAKEELEKQQQEVCLTDVTAPERHKEPFLFCYMSNCARVVSGSCPVEVGLPTAGHFLANVGSTEGCEVPRLFSVDACRACGAMTLASNKCWLVLKLVFLAG